MSQSPHAKQNHFDQLMADYQARVYETFLPNNQPAMDLLQVPNKDFARPSSPTILVVEDNADQWLMTQWALQQRYEKAKLVWLADGQALLPYLDSCQSRQIQLPCVILVDLYLPTAPQGLQVLHHLKAHPLYQLIPTIMLSWSDQPADILSAFEHSADGYLVKPSRYPDWQPALRLLDPYWTHRSLA
ncbi:response regulator [Spirosoma aerophilum]